MGQYKLNLIVFLGQLGLKSCRITKPEGLNSGAAISTIVLKELAHAN